MFFKSRPLLIYCIILQCFVIMVLIISNNNMIFSQDKYIEILMLVILLILIGITLYESTFVKEGVFEKGLILRGFMYQWSIINTYNIINVNDDYILLNLQLTNNSVRGIKIDIQYSNKIIEALDNKFLNKHI